MNNPHVLTLRVKIVILCHRFVDGFLCVFVLGLLDGCGRSDAGGDQGSPGWTWDGLGQQTPRPVPAGLCHSTSASMKVVLTGIFLIVLFCCVKPCCCYC